MLKRPIAWALLVFAAFLYAPQAGHAAKTGLFALIFRPAQDQDPILVQGFKLNGKDMLATFGRRQPPPMLKKRDYGRLPLVAADHYRRLFFLDGRLVGETTDDREIQVVLPQNIKLWPRSKTTAVRLPDLLRDIRMNGKVANSKLKYSGRLSEGMTVYLFLAAPTPDQIAFARAELSDSRASYESFLAEYPESSHVVRTREVLAVEYLTEIAGLLDAYEAALENKTAGYARLSEAAERLAQVQTFGTKKSEVKAASRRLDKLQSQLGKVLSASRKALEADDFQRAVDALDPIAHFAPEFAQLREQDASIRESAYTHAARRADHLSLEAKFDDALAALEEASHWKRTDEIAQLRQTIATRRKDYETRQALNAAERTADAAMAGGDFLAALKVLRPAVARHPEDPSLRDRYAVAQRKLRGSLLSQAPEIERAYTPLREGDIPGEDKVLDLYLGLAELAAAAPEDAEVLYWRDTLRDDLAEYYHNRARGMADSDEIPSPLAYAFLHQAYALAPPGAKRNIKEMNSWRPRVESNLGLRLALAVQDATLDLNARSAANLLRRLLIRKLQATGLPHLEILGNSVGGRSAAAPATLELRVDVTRASVTDTRKTETVRSMHSAGDRQVVNAEWEQAKLTYDGAVAQYEKLRTASAKKMKKKKRQKHQSALDAALAEMNASRKILDATPAYSDGDDVHPYEFSRATVTRTAAIEIEYQWLRRGVLLETKAVEHKESAEGVEISGVEPGDRNQHRNQNADLPGRGEMLGRALEAMQSSLSDAFLAYLDQFIARDLIEAKRLDNRNSPQAAAELYLRYLFNSRPGDANREQALEYLRNRFNLVTLDTWLDLTGGDEVNQAAR